VVSKVGTASVTLDELRALTGLIRVACE
jgi:hypothetical protein